ncbi:MAG: tetratricopeptide repeat protein [Bacteroidales bacterium]
MVILVATGLFVSKVYYQNINESVDPRIVEARKLYEEYNAYAENNNFNAIFRLLDSVESIYSGITHYQNSFEMGVTANNRAAVYLTLAMHQDSIELPENSEYLLEYPRDSLLGIAEHHLHKAIRIYQNWREKYNDLSKSACEEKIKSDFLKGLEGYSKEDQQKYLENRVDVFMDNQVEIDRRLSVSYTNLGVIYRLEENYDQAIDAYAKAIELWDRNMTAENNLNVLLGRPKKKQNFIHKLFPPDRDQN